VANAILVGKNIVRLIISLIEVVFWEGIFEILIQNVAREGDSLGYLLYGNNPYI
jgi:hypothetical protein